VEVLAVRPSKDLLIEVLFAVVGAAFFFFGTLPGSPLPRGSTSLRWGFGIIGATIFIIGCFIASLRLGKRKYEPLEITPRDERATGLCLIMALAVTGLMLNVTDQLVIGNEVALRVVASVVGCSALIALCIEYAKWPKS